MLYLALTTFLAEKAAAAAEYIIADLADKYFFSKSSCDAINDLPTLQQKI